VDIAESNRHVEEADMQIKALVRLKTQLTASLEEAKHQVDTESRERQSLLTQYRGFQHEVDQLREQINREDEAKLDLARQLHKVNSEVAEWRSRFEQDGLMRTDELEEHRRKLTARLSDMQDQLDVALLKVASVDQLRQKMLTELDTAHVRHQFLQIEINYCLDGSRTCHFARVHIRET
jgi:chromosome segregation ATPase